MLVEDSCHRVSCISLSFFQIFPWQDIFVEGIFILIPIQTSKYNLSRRTQGTQMHIQIDQTLTQEIANTFQIWLYGQLHAFVPSMKWKISSSSKRENYWESKYKSWSLHYLYPCLAVSLSYPKHEPILVYLNVLYQFMVLNL